MLLVPPFQVQFIDGLLLALFDFILFFNINADSLFVGSFLFVIVLFCLIIITISSLHNYY